MQVNTETNNILKFAAPPIMLAAWPGPGNVGSIAIDFLNYALQFERFIQLDVSALYSPEAIPVREGKFMRPEQPEIDFYFKREPPIILFNCDTRLGEKEALSIVFKVVQKAKEWGVSSIITLGGMPTIMDHTKHSVPCYASSEDGLSHDLLSAGFAPITEGEIAGPIGLLPSAAAAAGIRAGCIVATLPVYASATMYPKASLALVHGIERLLNLHLDNSFLERASDEMDVVYNGVADKIREHFPSILTPGETATEEEPDIGEPVSDPEPSLQVIAHIETLFKEAADDHAIAISLKRFLDQHGLFKRYEDRFLDLFTL